MNRVYAWSAAVVLCGMTALAAETGAGVSKGMKVEKYQVTGPVVEVTESKIVIQKDDGKWQIARDAATKGASEIKVGEKVTVEYKMIAVDIELKGAKKEAEKAEKAAEKAEKQAKK